MGDAIDEIGERRRSVSEAIWKRWRSSAVEQPRRALDGTQTLVDRAQTRTKRPADNLLGDAGRPRIRRCVYCIRQCRKDVRQQRRGDIGAEESRIRRPIRTSDPHTNRVPIAYTYSPRITETKTSPCLPRKTPIWTSTFHDSAHRPAGFENVADNERCAFAHHTALLEWRFRNESGDAGQSLADECGISAHQVLKSRAGSAKNHAQIRLSAFRKFQLQAAAPKH